MPKLGSVKPPFVLLMIFVEFGKDSVVQFLSDPRGGSWAWRLCSQDGFSSQAWQLGAPRLLSLFTWYLVFHGFSTWLGFLTVMVSG